MQDEWNLSRRCGINDSSYILSRAKYVYITWALGTLIDTVAYTYRDIEWGDLLTDHDGVLITYDTIGNPRSGGT